MSGRIIYKNGEYVPEKEATVSVYDSAMMYGDTVFEMTRSFNREHFKLNEHIQRLFDGLKYLRINIDLNITGLRRICHEVAKRNESAMRDNDEHRLMIDVTRGPLSIYRDVEGCHNGTNVIVTDFPLRWTIQGASDLYEHGVSAITPCQRTLSARHIDPKVKNRSRIHYLMANMQVANSRRKNAWALLLDEDGFVAEGAGANFFIVKNGKIITPEGRNVLRGISRAYVMELAEKQSIECVEKNIDIYDVTTADEAFFTCTPHCMVPVVEINETVIGKGVPGPVYNVLIGLWSRLVGVDIIGQAKQYDGENGAASDGITPYSFKEK